MSEFYDNNNPPTNDDSEEDLPIEKPENFIDHLMKLHYQGAITDQELRDHVNMIIFGGHDTSAFTIALTILMIAMHPVVEQRIMDELNEVLDLTAEQINQLTYMEQVLTEVIPANTDVIISGISAHRRKDIWGDDADTFNPDHFDKNTICSRNQYAFMAFSNGTRNCLGQRFAFISIKIVLAKLFRKYRFFTDWTMEDIKFRLEVTCKPVNGIILKAKEHKKLS